MLAVEQLKFVEDMVAEFERTDSTMAPVLSAQSQYIAMISMLRAVGHVFQKVDCDTPQKSQWGKSAWKEWQKEPIFADFIEPTRNNLLKQFRGAIQINDEAFGSLAITGPNAQILGGFNAAKLRDADGNPVMPKVHQALGFWRRRLQEAAEAFGSFAS